MATPLNEVRMLAGALMDHGGVVAADKTIRMKSAASLLHHEVGDEVRLSEADFRALAAGFLAEIRVRYA